MILTISSSRPGLMSFTSFTFIFSEVPKLRRNAKKYNLSPLYTPQVCHHSWKLFSYQGSLQLCVVDKGPSIAVKGIK